MACSTAWVEISRNPGIERPSPEPFFACKRPRHMAPHAGAPQVKAAKNGDVYSAAGGTISFARLPFSNLSRGPRARTSRASFRTTSEPEARSPKPVVLRLNSYQVWPAGHRRAVGAQVVGSGGEGDIEDIASGLRAQNVHHSVAGRDVEQVPVESERGAQRNRVAVERDGG